MAAEARYLHLRGALGAVRTEHWDGREHLVVPCVALQEGVIHAVNAETPEFVSTAVLTASRDRWNGHPLVLGHPTRGGKKVSAHDLAIMEQHGFGFVRDARINSTRLGLEALVDISRLEKLGQTRLLADLRAGKPIEVSVGAFVSTNGKAGTHNGKPYKGEWTEITPDHLAFLPEGIGACSLAAGCGAHRAAMHLVTAEGIEAEVPPMNTGLKDRLSSLLRALMPRGWGDDEVKQELRDALADAEPAFRNGGEIVRVKNDAVVYCLYPPANYYDAPGAAPTYWSRAYTFDTTTQAFTVSIDRQQVEPTTVYAPMRAAKAGYEDCAACDGSGNKDGNPCESCDGAGELKVALKAACGCEGDSMKTKAERVAALLTNEHNPLKDEKGLLASDDKGLEALEAHCTNAATLKAAADKVEADKKSAADKASADLKAAEEAKKTVEVKLAETVAELKDASEKPLSDEEFLKRAPESIRTLVADKKAADEAEKTSLVTTLKTAQSVHSEEKLKTMSLVDLRDVAALVNVPAADFSGRGVPVPRGAGANEDFTPPNSYERELKALQDKAHSTVN